MCQWVQVPCIIFIQVSPTADLTKAELPKLASQWNSSATQVFFDGNKNVHFTVRSKDDLPKEIRGKAFWTKCPEFSESIYELQAEGRFHAIEYINNGTTNKWYWIYYNQNIKRFWTSATLKIIQPEVLGLGNSKAPQLEPQDQQRVHAVSESISSQEEAGPS